MFVVVRFCRGEVVVLFLSISVSLSFSWKPQEVWNTSMSSRCTWPASFLAAGCFLCANLHRVLICIYGDVVFVCQCALLTFYNPSAVGDYSYTLTVRLWWLKNSRTFYCTWMQSVWWLPPHFPCPVSVFKQEEGSGGVRLSTATSNMSVRHHTLSWQTAHTHVADTYRNVLNDFFSYYFSLKMYSVL